jgi:hypothetical protein
VDTSKKVFSQNEVQEEDENSNFSQARQAALAEAMDAKLKITKTFVHQVSIKKLNLVNTNLMINNFFVKRQ